MGADKLWADVGGRPLIALTLDAVALAGSADLLVVVAPEDGWDDLRRLHHGRAELRLVGGGDRRQDSVRIAVELCTAWDVDLVCVHDAARPLCPPALFGASVEAARRHGAATAAVPLVDSVKRVDARGEVVETLDRSALVAVQTPQAFRIDVLAGAHREAVARATKADDDCALVEAAGHRVHIVDGDPRNFKVTTPSDLAVLRCLAGAGR